MRLISPRQRTFATPSGWCVVFGNVHNSDGNFRWRDKHFAIIEGPWETSVDERFVIAGDVRITNRTHLLDEIMRSGALLDQSREQLPAITDLRIVATLWHLHDEATVQRLRGTYAFCIWDRTRQTGWLIRDRVGAETLYYTTEEVVSCAGARIANVVKETSSDLDMIAIRDYLSCAFVPGSRTMFRRVKELRPGTIMRIPSCELSTYWQVRDRVNNGDLPIESYSTPLRATLEQAITDSLPTPEPVGVYLSGGLDSSCVLALTAQLHTAQVHSYSIHFGNDCPNELEYSSIVAKHCQTRHHVIEITSKSMWELLPETMAHLDDPIGDPLTVPNLILGQTAKADVNTILNGEGGDPCFGGPKNQPMILNQIYGPTTDTSQTLVASYLASFQKCANDLPRLMHRDIWKNVRNEPTVFDEALQISGSYLNRLMFINTRFKGADQILTKVNNLTRAVGLRGYSPLFDDRMVELSLEIPPEYKLEGAREKAVLKAAVADLLPTTILERPKSGMMVPVQRWFREHWSKPATTLLLSRSSRIRQFLNQEIIRDWLNYREDLWGRYGVKLWLLVSLELWLQSHVRN
jgi:asparagine synthase (glutamine-hydrolysing)